MPKAAVVVTRASALEIWLYCCLAAALAKHRRRGRIIRAAMHIYAGWVCQTPGCGEEILFKYLGEQPIPDKKIFTPPSSLPMTCRKCGQRHEYSDRKPQIFLSAARLEVYSSGQGAPA